MDYITFTMELMELLHEMLGDELEVTLEKIPKNNGIILDGLIFGRKGHRAAPVLYVQEFYEFWKKGMPMEQLVENLIWNLYHCENDLQIPQDFFMDYRKLQDKIFYKVINYQQNQQLLNEIPYRRILDLAMVFYYRLDDMPATVLIKNSHLHLWGISKELLENDARKNTYLKQTAEFLSMADISDEDDVDESMYILTNQDRMFGAGALFYPAILKEAEILMGGSFFILPSSVHECILVPDDKRHTKEELSYMVSEINRHYVDPREVLSDHAYYYKVKDGCIHL